MSWRLRQAVRSLRNGGLLAYPTEAVWGLGCDPANEQALDRLLRLKQRPWQKGLILVAADWAQLQPWLALEQPPAPLAPLWPGPVTALLPPAPGLSPLLTGQHHRIAVRISAHPPVRALCHAFGGALVSTSANRHGHPAPRTVFGVRQQLTGAGYAVYNAALGAATRPSRIIDPFSGEILRP